MFDYTLIFPDEAQATAVLYDGETPLYPAIDTIGTIEGATGWHVNVRTDTEAPELEVYQVFPETPVRVWA